MLALATLLLLTAPTAEAKGKPGRKSKKTEAAAEKADTTKKEKKGYEELLKGAVTDKGMFDVHRKGTDFLFEIPDSLMGRRHTDRQQDFGRPLRPERRGRQQRHGLRREDRAFPQGYPL